MLTAECFDDLPTEDKVRIRWVVHALNESTNAAEFEQSASQKDKPHSPTRPRWLEKLRERQSRSTRDPWQSVEEGLGAKEAKRIKDAFARYMDALGREALQELRAQFARVVEGQPLDADSAARLASEYDSEVIVRSMATVGVDGRVAITDRRTFKSAGGEGAYCLLLVAALSAHTPVILSCANCRKFVLIESTGGEAKSRFCSRPCNNAFSQREFRRRAAARKHK